jgi:hypothetical protein
MLLFSIPLLSQYAPFYVLDGYGGVHAGGYAPAITPGTPYWGWDIAKSIDYVPVAYSSSIYGDGYFVLDGYGGVWQGGKLASISMPKTPYWGFNVARSIVYRVVDPEAFGTTNTTMGTFSDLNVLHTLTYFYLNLPDAGWVLVMANGMIWNISATSASDIRYGIGIDSSTAYDDATHRWAELGDTYLINLYPSHVMSTSRLVYLTAGQHYFYFLVQQVNGTGVLDYNKVSMSAVYINKDYDQWSNSAIRTSDQQPTGPLAGGVPGGDGRVK